MREYKMGRGEYLDERVDDMESMIEEYFGPVAGTTEYNDSELFVVEDPDNGAVEKVIAGTVEYSGKKNKVALDTQERPPKEVLDEGLEDEAEEALSMKNEFLEAATGRDAEARRKSMKRDVEDDETPDDVA